MNPFSYFISHVFVSNHDIKELIRDFASVSVLQFYTCLVPTHSIKLAIFPMGSNALATQLHLICGVNSSAYSSNCQTPDDMYSVTSLEEEVRALVFCKSKLPSITGQLGK